MKSADRQFVCRSRVCTPWAVPKASVIGLASLAILALSSACGSGGSQPGDEMAEPSDEMGGKGPASPEGPNSQGPSDGKPNEPASASPGAPSPSASASPRPADAPPVFAPTPAAGGSWVQASTVSRRVALPLAGQGALLMAQTLTTQLQGYDPGSLLRCDLAGQDAYDVAVDALGGVSWGYSVLPLEDQSKPIFMKGFPEPNRFAGDPTAEAGFANDSAPVEIVKPDVVAVTESAAVFFSNVHGLLLVDLTGVEPQFKCAAAVPGRVDQFFFHEGHLIAMAKSQDNQNSHLLHFSVTGTELGFVEDVDLGNVNILDSRRFNDKLVFYTDHRLAPPPAPASNPNDPQQVVQVVPVSQAQHRALRVFNFGDSLEEEMYDTLIDETSSEDQLAYEAVNEDTPVGSVVSQSRRFGYNMWASDHYFVVTEELWKTSLVGWQSRTYTVCTESHTVEVPYEYCQTDYETRPNPEYVEPDNSGGDRQCNGITLADCLRQVAKVANKTIQVAVGRTCEERVRHDWICDARENRTVEYPQMTTERSTQLYIYEYHEDGFVKLDSQVHEITTEGLDAQDDDASVTALSTSAETFDLAVPGTVQTLYFQNGYLYVISEGILQVYVMGGSSLVRTSTLQVVNESLQSTLFSSEQLILSDFGWRAGDHSTLRVVNLSNPAFPTVEAASHELPGGHRSIIASEHGIFTIGAVNQFEGQTINALKLGLFTDPYVEETAYLILATDLNGAWLGQEEAQHFNGAAQRLLLPYWGRDEANHTVQRIGVSRIEAASIESEGAVVVPEAPTRVRPILGDVESYLSFATNSIEWLTPAGGEWQASPVLEYYVPTAVYRLTDEDDYVEIQRLGDRCKLYFAHAGNINQRADGFYSELFDCYGYPRAFDDQLLFGETAIEFGDQGSVRYLTADEITETQSAIASRDICLLSLELVPDAYAVDYYDLPDEADVTCMTQQEYQVAYQELISSQQQ